MAIKYIKIERGFFLAGVNNLAQRLVVYGLVKRATGLGWKRLNGKEENLELFGARPIEPIKIFFYPPSEEVAGIPEVPAGKEEKRVLLGVKGCDLESLKTTDHIYRLGENPDPRYFSRRDNTLIISSDCSAPDPACFCLLHGRTCYSQSDFDLNLSPLNGEEILIEIGSEKGERFLQELGKRELREAKSKDLSLRDKNRQECMERLKTLNAPFTHQKPYSEIVRKSNGAQTWKKYGEERCVQCHACNLGCPTCYCFSFADLPEKEGMKRYKNWDSCLTASFARMASGANPRPFRWERFRYHYYHKFDFLNKELGFDACTGCGRCIAGCLGKIDKRQVFLELEKEIYE